MPCACCKGRKHIPGTNEPFIDITQLERHLHLDNGKQDSTLSMIKPSEEGRGRCQLQALPTECFQACLQFLDIASLTRMRRVSQFTRSTIDRDLYEHAPQALRACLATGVAAYISLLRLHESLTTMECYYCKKGDPSLLSFGTHLSLFEGRRTCLFCLRNNPALVPVELRTVITLCFQRNSPLKSIDNYRLLGTVPGMYGPCLTPVKKRSSLIRGPSIATAEGVHLNEREESFLLGTRESVEIYHHTYIAPSDESDLRLPSQYVYPEDAKRALLLYQTAVPFPYLTSGKKICDYGVLCGECNLHMWWQEHRWSNEQSLRRSRHIDPTASDRVRGLINSVRRKACFTYTISDEAYVDSEKIIARLRERREAPEPDHTTRNGNNRDGQTIELKPTGALTIQEHRLIHELEVLPMKEREYRAMIEARKIAPPQPPYAT